MSLARLRFAAVICCFPRVSGDEPTAQKHFRRLKQFSPRERG